MTSKELSKYLDTVHPDVGLIDKLKIVYRPYICPFVELINSCKGSTSILDIGCGSGQFLLLLSKYSTATKLGGIEISPKLIKNAHDLLNTSIKSGFRLEQYDGTHIPDFISDFETLTLIDVFHHIKKRNQETFMSALYDRMKSGTKFIFKDIDASHPLLFMSLLHDLILAGETVNMMSVSQAKKMLERSGFRIISVSEKLMAWYPHYTIICVKE